MASCCSEESACGAAECGVGSEDESVLLERLRAEMAADYQHDVAIEAEISEHHAFDKQEADSDASLLLPFLEASPLAQKKGLGAECIPADAESTSYVAGVSSTGDDPSKRRRIVTKQSSWDAFKDGNNKKQPNPLIFVDNPCYKKYKAMETSYRQRVDSRMRQKKSRLHRSVKSGLSVQMQERTFSWPAREEDEATFVKELDMAFFFEAAGQATASVYERGFAMDRLLAMQERGITPTEGKALDIKAKHLQTRSLLMTYQGAWGLLSELSPPPTMPMDALVKIVQAHRPAAQNFDSLLQMYEDLKSRQRIEEYVVSQEICTHTWSNEGIIRLHFHAWVLKPSGSALELEEITWKTHSPHLNTNAFKFFGGRGSRSVSASYSGAYYLQIEKKGLVRTKGSVAPYSSYQVKDFWITGLLAGSKIDFDTARKAYVGCVVRAEQNVKQLEFVQKERYDEQARIEKVADDAVIVRSQSAFKVLPEVEEWRRQYSSVSSRYKFLVLDGPSRTGKTRFAYSLSPPPMTHHKACNGTTIPVDEHGHTAVFYADCSGGLPDLRQFRRREHQVLVLDELHPKSAVLVKKIMQASNDCAVLGASPTMQHAYSVNSFRTMIVVTTNTWAAGMVGMPESDVEWLKANSVYVHVQHKLWK